MSPTPSFVRGLGMAPPRLEAPVVPTLEAVPFPSPTQQHTLRCQATQLLPPSTSAISGETNFMHKKKKRVTCLNVSTSLTLVLLAQGIQTLHPSLSTGDTPKKMSQACTQVTSSPWRPKTCTQSVSANSNVPDIPRTSNWNSRNNNGNGSGQIRGYPHFQQLRPILVDACALADDLRREHEILEDLLVDVRQSPAARPLLFDARIACRLAEDSALGHKNNMTVGKFLLQLASKPRMVAKKK